MESPQKPFFNYVKGHQEELNRVLTTWEEMNIVINVRVKLALWELILGEQIIAQFIQLLLSIEAI